MLYKKAQLYHNFKFLTEHILMCAYYVMQRNSQLHQVRLWAINQNQLTEIKYNIMVSYCQYDLGMHPTSTCMNILKNFWCEYLQLVFFWLLYFCSGPRR